MKVRSIGGSWFDPMLEEERGLAAGKVLGHVSKVMEEVIEAMAEGNKLALEEELNPFRGKHGEILSKDIERSFSGFLIRKMLCHSKLTIRNLSLVLRSSRSRS